MKNGLLIINAFYKTRALTEVYDALTKAFLNRGTELVKKTSAETIANFKDYDFAIFWDKDTFLAKNLEKNGVKCCNNSHAIAVCDDKLLSAETLINAGIPHPTTIPAPFTYPNIGYDNHDFIAPICDKLGFPLIVKAARGSLGEQVFLTNNLGETKNVLKEIAPERALFQKFISTSFGTDIRIYVVGGNAIGAIKRTGVQGSFKSNIALGGSAEKFDAPKNYLKTAVLAANACGADFAGVDILIGENNAPIVCEINTHAFFSAFACATGVNPAESIAEFILSKR